jgi:HEPN domain-containing protein
MPARRIPRGGTRGTVYRDVAIHRLDDAQALPGQRRYNGAVYLAGYAVECQLKYAYCKRFNVVHLPASLETHDWDVLVEKAQLRAEINLDRRMRAFYQALADRWGPSLRYSTSRLSKSEAERLYTELKELYRFIVELEP